MGEFNRRDFLKLSAAGAVGASLSLDADAAEVPTSLEPRGSISVWQTSGKLRHERVADLKWNRTVNRTHSRSGASIAIDPAKQFQKVLGFGAAFTDAACFTLNRLSTDARAELFHDFFHPSELGLNVSRICVGSSDYATKAYSYCDGAEPDPELARFSIDHDKAYILPILREARAVSPEMWILASPWSPPGWMKFNGSMLGGMMRRKYLNVYSQYFEKFLDAYAAEGVRVDSITSQNEVDTDQDGRMPACAWPQEMEIEFVRDFMGPRMAKAKNPADIWILDHNYNLWGRVLDCMDDSKLRPFVKGVAWHGYVGTAEAMTRIAQQYPEVGQFWTEGGPDFETPGYETEWTKWAAQFAEILRNRARCIIAWNYALDQNGNPNIGPFHCAGLVTIDSETAKITRSGQYWALAHFSGHIRRDAQVVASTMPKDLKDVQHVIARNADGRFVAVLSNSGTETSTVALNVGHARVPVELPADSVVTLEWA